MESIQDTTLKSFKVLIVDDDESTRILLGATISQWGYEIIEASNGEQAWKILQKSNDIRLVILDWIMPKMEGIELCKIIRKELIYHPYIILLTQYTGTPNIISGLEAGADEFLAKPFNIGELRSRMAVAVRIIKYENRLAEQNKKLEQDSADLKKYKTLVQEASNQIAELVEDCKDSGKIANNMEKIKALQKKLINST